MATATKSSDLLTPSEAAEILGISVRRVQQLCQDGAIPHRMAGSRRILTRREVADFKRRKRPPGNPNFGRKSR